MIAERVRRTRAIVRLFYAVRRLNGRTCVQAVWDVVVILWKGGEWWSRVKCGEGLPPRR